MRPDAITTIAELAKLHKERSLGAQRTEVPGDSIGESAQRTKIWLVLPKRHHPYQTGLPRGEAARALVVAVFTRANVSPDELFAFNSGTAAAVFLLNADMAAYFAEMRTKAQRLQQLNQLINEPPTTIPEPDQTNAPEEKANLANWFVAQNEVLIEKFRPFLAL